MRGMWVVLAMLPLACGGGSGASPTPPATDLVFTAPFVLGGGAPIGVVPHSVEDVLLDPGAVDVVADWTSPSSNLDLVVTASSCDDRSFLAGVCPALASDRGSAKPATVRFSQATAGMVRIWVVSWASENESGVLNVYLTR